MTIQLMIRGYLGSTIMWEQYIATTEIALKKRLPALAQAHAEEFATGRLGMIEIEFLDEPDPNKRFFRMGVDPSGMVKPIGIKL